MADLNERFPFIMRVTRPANDQYGDPATDAEGNPTFVAVPLDVVRIKYDSEFDWTGTPQRNADGSFVTDSSELIHWGYRTSTGGFRDSGEVAEADYKIATPMFITPLETGDRIEATDYDRTRIFEVLKKTTYNWGTNIWVKDIKN